MHINDDNILTSHDSIDFNEKKTFKYYLASVHCFVDDFEDEVRPYHVKHEEYS